MVEVKFCGMTREADVVAAAELGARYVGCILAESPRRVSIGRATEIAREATRNGLAPFFVLSPVDIEDVLTLLDMVGPSGLQLHGQLDDDAFARLRERFGGEVWHVVRVGASGTLPDARWLFESADGVVLDTLSPRALGGTGETFDWRETAANLESLGGIRRARIILAGGLRPENVAEAIDILAPDVVDVSSGVELSPGIKDHARMRAFVDAVRGC